MKILEKTKSIFKSLSVYKEILANCKKTVFCLVISNVLASFCEGMAIVVLIPLIQLSTGNSTEEISVVVTSLLKLMEYLNLEINIPSVVSVFLFFSFFSAASNYISNFFSVRFKVQAEADLRQRLFNSLFKSQWVYLSRTKIGSLAKSLLQDTNQASMGFLHLLSSISFSIAFFVLLFLAAILSIQMTLLTILFAILIMPFYLFILKKGQTSGQAASSFADKLSAETTEMLVNGKLLFSQGLRKISQDRFGVISHSWYKELVKQAHQNSIIRFVFEFSAALFVSIFLLIVLWYEQQPISLTIVFLMIFYRLAPRLSQFQTSLYLAATNSSWMMNWKKLYNETIKNEQIITGNTIPTLLRDIKFKNVTFAYPKSNEATLKDVSFDIPSCSCLAIIGGSGQGKSTTLDLLTGLATPQKGSIEIDGENLNDINLNIWQSHIGMVLQENPIINATIAENIVFGHGETDINRLKEVATLAGAMEFIEKMPKGFDTLAGERGSRLSGGQKQRVALARALYRKPWLLLLDEITSALDGISTETLIKSLKELKSSMTIILVTHDHRLLDMADLIMEIDNGKITLK